MFKTTDARVRELRHLRTVDSLALLVDLVNKWSNLSTPFEKSMNMPTSRREIASKTKEYRYQRLSTQTSHFQAFIK